MPALFFVTELTDNALPGGHGAPNPNGGSGDLRYCITQANSNHQANTIDFDLVTFATAQTIDLSAPISLTDAYGTQTIFGPAAGVTIKAPSGSDILTVSGGVTASLSRLTFTGGLSGSGGLFGGGTPIGNGGAISNAGNLTLQNCQITGNVAGEQGGGVYNSGTLTLNSCTVSGNFATRGGGIYNSGVLSLDSTQLSNNEALYGGAVSNEKGTATATLTNCTVSGNKAGSGGGFYNLASAQLTLVGCNLSGDTAFGDGGGVGNPASGQGGGVFNKGTLDLTNCTINGETGLNGDGLYNSGTATISDQTTIENNQRYAKDTYPSNGAGIFNTGSITVTDSKVTGNTATQNGGGIANYGHLTMTDCIVQQNVAGGNGGGIEDDKGGLTITNSALLFNLAVGNGGGIGYFSVSSTMRDCTVSGNRAVLGGGMSFTSGNILNSTFAYNHASQAGGGIYQGVSLTNCTIYDNTAYQVTKHLDGSFTYAPGKGGGISQNGSLPGNGAVLTNCTIFKNEASRFAKGSRTGYNGGQGGDIYNGLAAFTLNNCLVAGSTSFGDAIVGTVSGNNNLVDEQNDLTEITGNHNSYSAPTALYLGVINYNGGTTPTVAPNSPHSPLVDNGDPALIPAGVTTDQRGASRTRKDAAGNDTVDIGAVESNANIIVTTLTDEDNGGPDPVLGTGTSLREAINFANLDPSENDTITFVPGLTGTLDLTLGALPTLTAGVTIDGPGANVVTIDGLGANHILSIASGVGATVSGLSLTGASGGSTGAVVNNGTLDLFNCAITRNEATNGGGVYNTGTLVLSGCAITGNDATNGGGVYNTGTLSMADCTVSANQVKTNAAALLSDGQGGGVYSSGPLTMINCTLSGNTAWIGAGIEIAGSNPATVTNCTIAGNTALYHGGGIAGQDVTLNNTIVADNGGGDIWAMVSGNNNLVDDAASAGINGFTLTNSLNGNIVGVPAKLGPLQYNGGPTKTIQPLPGSPAINAGSNVLVPSGVTSDQRGAPRIKDITVDIGALETGPDVLTVTKLDDSSDPQAVTLRAAINFADTFDPTDPVTITFAPGLEGTLTLTQGPLPAITGNVAIVGPGANRLTIDGNAQGNILSVQPGAFAELQGLTLADGNSATPSVAGGITNWGTTVIVNCEISANVGLGGGGIANHGSLLMLDSTLDNNQTSGTGGGLDNDGQAKLIMCTVAENSATVVAGGGIFNGGAGQIILDNCTVAKNFALLEGDGLANTSTHPVTLNNSIICSSTGPGGDLSGPVTASYTWIGSTFDNAPVSGPGNLIGTGEAPLLPLGHYGGPTPTMPITTGQVTSPVNFGSGALVPPGIIVDQRGARFDSSGSVEMGSCESGGTTIVVTTLADLDKGSIDPISGGGTSLRDAINFVNADAARGELSDTITFSPVLKGTIDLSFGALPTITVGVTITGPGADVLTIDGQNQNGIFSVAAGGALNLSGVTLAHGSAAQGGAIQNLGGTVDLTDCTLSDSTATTVGGGLFNTGTSWLTDCTLSGNSAGQFGGGLYNGKGTVTLTDCTVSGNTALSSAGLDLYGGTNSLVACTVSGNTGTGTASFDVAGIYVAGVSTTINDTIVSGNTGPAGASDLGGSGTATGSNNLIGTGSVTGSNNQLGVTHPNLGPLAWNGGPTQTMALLPGSPAIGAGSITAEVYGDDQRGLQLDSPKPDIGAFQYQGAPPSATITLVPPSSPPTVQVSLTFTLHATDPSSTDQNGTFTYTVDWNNDGSDVEKYTGPATMPVTHFYATASPPSSAGYTPSVVAVDQDGRSSAPALAAPVQVAPLPPNYLTTVPATVHVTFSISDPNQQLAAQDQLNVSPTSNWKGSSVSLQVTSATPVADVIINPPPAATVTVTPPAESPIASLFAGQGGGQGLQIAEDVSVAVAFLVVGLATAGVGDIFLADEVVEDVAEVPELSSVATPLQQPLATVAQVADTMPVADANVIGAIDNDLTITADGAFNGGVNPFGPITIIDMGESPALTVAQGNVNWSNALMGTSTDSSTTIVRGGMLTLTDNITTGNFQGSQPLIEVDGGTVILGSADGTHGNALATYGSAPFVDVESNGMVIVQPGNVFDQMTSNLTVQHAGTTSVQLVSSAPTTTPGQTVTFTATVSAGSAPPTDGSIEFFDETAHTFLGKEPIINGSASVQAQIGATGGDTIYATYLPTSNALAPSSGHLTQIVAYTTSSKLTGPASNPTYGQSVMFTATVTSSGGGAPTGSVEFYDGSIDLGPGTTLSGSGNTATSTFTIATLTGGAHDIHAVFTSSGAFQTSNDTLAVTVNKAAPMISVNPVSITYGTVLKNSQLTGTASWTFGIGGSPVSVAGAFSYTSAAGTLLNLGSGQTEAVTFTPSDSTDYTAVSTSVPILFPATGLSFPESVAVDQQGNVFIADSGNNRVVEVAPNGTQVTIGSFYQPVAVAVDGQDNVFVTDGTFALWVVPNGTDTPIQIGGGFMGPPPGVAPDSHGDVFYADTANNQVVEQKADGTFAVVLTGLNQPRGVAVDASGDVFIADTGDNQVREVLAGVQVTVLIPPAVVTNPSSQTAGSGQTVTFTAAARGFPNPSVQWLVAPKGSSHFQPVANNASAGTTTLSVVAQAADSGSQYEAVFTSAGNSVTTTAATLTVSATGTVPTINAGGSPGNVTVAPNTPVTFSAADGGTPTPTVQWQLSVDGGNTFSNISGATATTYKITAQSGDNGYQYRAVFTNPYGVARTSAATLTVTGAPTTPPVVSSVQQAAAGAVNAGHRVTLTAVATNAPEVQWQVSTDGVNFTNIPGATTTTYSFIALSSQNGNKYRALFSNPFGQTPSGIFTLAVNPTVTLQPASQTVYAGQTATFTATAIGNPTPSVEWQVSSDGKTYTPLSSSATLSFTAMPAQNGLHYRAVFTDTIGAVNTQTTTNAVVLTVRPAPKTPVIIAQPAKATVSAGQTASFTSAAVASSAPSVQWQVLAKGSKTWEPISVAQNPTANTNTLVVTTAAADNGNQYRAVFTVGKTSVTSLAATLTLLIPPAVASSPKTQTVAVNTPVIFQATATGSPASVQWQVSIDGGVTYRNIAGATLTKYTLTARALDNGNLYRAIFTNAVGQVETDAAALLVP